MLAHRNLVVLALIWIHVRRRWFDRCDGIVRVDNFIMRMVRYSHSSFKPISSRAVFFSPFCSQLLLNSLCFLLFLSHVFTKKTIAIYRSGIKPTPEEFESLQLRFGFMSEHGVQFLRKGATIYQLPPGKVGVPFPIFEAGLRLPMTNFFDETMR